MSLVFTGMQPSGSMHIGNYIGMVKPMLDLDDQVKMVICGIVDYHAITVWQSPAELRENTIKLAATLMACGFNYKKNILFVQSQVNEHAELAWILSSVARMGWLNRMTQYKDKSQGNHDSVSAGLYTYPVMMAADILIYNANLVPAGEDQKQHLEFARDIAIKFNNDYNTDHFVIPEPLIYPNTRIMSLKDGSKKMSKSDPSDYSRILINDSNDDIIKKFKKAKTDNSDMPTTVNDLRQRPELFNLINIYSFLTGTKLEESLKNFVGFGFAQLKQEIAEATIVAISPIRSRYEELMQDRFLINSVLNDGAEHAKSIAVSNIQKIKNIVGFYKIC